MVRVGRNRSRYIAAASIKTSGKGGGLALSLWTVLDSATGSVRRLSPNESEERRRFGVRRSSPGARDRFRDGVFNRYRLLQVT